MDILHRVSGKLGDIVLTKDFIVLDRPRLTAILPVHLVQYVGYPKEWNENAGVQVFVGGQEHSLYMAAQEAKEFVDLLLGLIAAK